MEWAERRTPGTRSVTPQFVWGTQGNRSQTPRPYNLSSRTPTPEQWAKEKAIERLKTPPLAPRPNSVGGFVRKMQPHLPQIEGERLGASLPDAIDEVPLMRPRSQQAQDGHFFLDTFSARSWEGPPKGRAVRHQVERVESLSRQGLSPMVGGGSPRPWRTPISAPAAPAAPAATPHNTWCTFVDWKAPADGDEDPEFRYDLKIRHGVKEEEIVLYDLGKECRTQLNGLESRVFYYFQVRGRNSCGAGPWSSWSLPYTVTELEQGSYNLERITNSESATSAVLSWQEPCGHGQKVHGYRLEYCTDTKDKATYKKLTHMSHETSVRVSSLLPNSMYFFRVKAINSAGESEWTDWSDGVATKALEPEAPSKPKIVEALARELQLSWTVPSSCGFDIIRFDVEVSENDPSMAAPAEMQVDGVGDALEWKLSINDLTPSTTYYARVRAWSAMGASSWSEVSDKLRTLPAVPEVCEELRVKENVPRRIVLSWKVPESHGLPVTGFRLAWWVSEGARSDFVRRDDIDVLKTMERKKGDVITHEVKSITPGDGLRFVVVALNELGEGTWTCSSEPLEVLAAADAPDSPNPPFVSSRTARSLEVDIADTVIDGGSKVLYYELRYSQNSDMTNVTQCPGRMRVINPVSAGKPRFFRYSVAHLQERGPYFFSVRAVNEVGASPWSAISAAFYLTVSAPAKMSSPFLAGNPDCRSLLIAYTPPADLGSSYGGLVQSFDLKYARYTSALDDADVPIISWNAPKGDDLLKPEPQLVRQLCPGRRYVFQVRATSALGAGPWSDPSESFEVTPSVPEKPEAMLTLTGSINFPAHGIMLSMTMPEQNGRNVQRVQVRVAGPYAKWKGEARDDVEWRDFIEIEPVKDYECSVEEVTRETPLLEASNPNQYWVWHYRLLRMGTAMSYVFSFRCVNEVGWSEWSDASAETTTSPDVPQQGSPPTATDIDFNYIDLEWTYPPDTGSPITSFIMEWASNPRWENKKTILDLQEPRYSLRNLNPKCFYFIRIAAVNEKGAGHFSVCDPRTSEGVFTTLATVPDAPTDVMAKNTEDCELGQLMVYWNKPMSNGGHVVSRYKIFYSPEPDMTAAFELVTKGRRHCKLVNLTPDTVYYVEVAAINKIDSSARSNQASAKTSPVPIQASLPPQVPLAPLLQCLPVDDPTTGVAPVKVSWKCPEMYHPTKGFIYDAKVQTEPIKTYSIQFFGCSRHTYRAPDFSPSDLAVMEQRNQLLQVRDRRLVPKDEHNHTTFENLDFGYYYFSRVMSHHTMGDSPWSEMSAAARTPPTTPSQITAVRELEKPKNSLRVEWDQVKDNGEDVTHYEVLLHLAPEEQEPSDEPASPDEEDFVRRFSVDAGECSVEGQPGICQHFIGGLVHATFYRVSVRPINSVGPGAWTLSDRLRTLSAPPCQMSRVVGMPEKATTSSICFSWEPPEDVGGEELLGYEVRWLERRQWTGELTGGRQEPVKVACDVLWHVADNLRPGDAALPVVRCWNAIGYSPWSDAPESAEEIEALSCLPVPPAETIVPPRILQMKSDDHRPFWMSAHWVCPPNGGRFVRGFKLTLRSLEDSTEDPIEYSLDHTGDEPWAEGQELSLAPVHTQMVPGVEYVLSVRASSEVGDALGWGVPSAPARAPADYPEQPAPPKSPWQWPTAIEVVWTSPVTKGAELEQCAIRYSEHSEPKALEATCIDVEDMTSNQNFEKKSVLIENLRISSPLYYFQVRVRNAVGWSPWSDASEGYGTGACKPEDPQKLAMVQLGTKQIQVQWEQPDAHGRPITEYEVMLSEQENADVFQSIIDSLNECGEDEDAQLVKMEGIPIKERVVRPTSSLDSELTPTHWFEGLLGGQGYSASVRAYNCMGWSDWCPVLGPMITKAAVPERPLQPILLVATQETLTIQTNIPYDGGARITEMELFWTRVNAAIDRHIALGGTSTKSRGESQGFVRIAIAPISEGGPAAAPPDGHGGPSEVTLEGMEAGSEYELRVRAMNPVGYGPISEVALMLTTAGLPEVPTMLRHTSRTDVRADAGTHVQGPRAIALSFEAARSRE